MNKFIMRERNCILLMFSIEDWRLLMEIGSPDEGSIRDGAFSDRKKS
jgi:hypothetical protein